MSPFDWKIIDHVVLNQATEYNFLNQAIEYNPHGTAYIFHRAFFCSIHCAQNFFHSRAQSALNQIVANMYLFNH